MPDTNDELLPCPFCGGEAELIIHGNGGMITQMDSLYTVKCKQCRAETGAYEERSTARHQWNRRRRWWMLRYLKFKAWNTRKETEHG